MGYYTDYKLSVKENNVPLHKEQNLLFILNGTGEESGDIWCKYYQNGKMQLCEARIVFDEFDPKKLK